MDKVAGTYGNLILLNFCATCTLICMLYAYTGQMETKRHAAQSSAACRFRTKRHAASIRTKRHAAQVDYTHPSAASRLLMCTYGNCFRSHETITTAGGRSYHATDNRNSQQCQRASSPVSIQRLLYRLVDGRGLNTVTIA